MQSARLSTPGAPARIRQQCYNFAPASTSTDAMLDPTCQHGRRQLIAKDKDAQYEECLDCGEILEAGEIEKKEGAGFDESLSDA